MRISEVFKQYLEHLFVGRRAEAREMMFAAHDRSRGAAMMLVKVVWPAMEQVERLYREDRIPKVVEHMATRINRMVADQMQAYLPRKPKSGRRMVVVCGDGEPEELGAQIIADLFECRGWSVWFVGSGVASDEVLELVGKLTPDILCIYGAHAESVPGIRGLITTIRDVGVCEEMQVLVAGGVFNRAEGLADEVKADLFARDAAEALKTVADHPVRIPKPDVPEPGRRRKRKKSARRKPAMKAAGRPRKMRKTKVTVKA